MQTVKIRAPLRRSGKTWALVGTGLTLACVGVTFFYEAGLAIVAAFIAQLLLLGSLYSAIGFRLPRYSLVVCHDHLQFHHPYGGWTLPWQNIRRIDTPSLGRGFQRQPMDYIGLCIDDYASFLDGISPRFCAHQLTDQRVALLAAIRADESNHDALELFEDDTFILSPTCYYSGLVAMYANRMHQLRTLTGYDLLIESKCLDRPSTEVIHLLRQFKLNASQNPN
jgi:hypothetical protein